MPCSSRALWTFQHESRSVWRKVNGQRWSLTLAMTPESTRLGANGLTGGAGRAPIQVGHHIGGESGSVASNAGPPVHDGWAQARAAALTGLARPSARPHTTA